MEAKKTWALTEFRGTPGASTVSDPQQMVDSGAVRDQIVLDAQGTAEPILLHTALRVCKGADSAAYGAFRLT